MQATLYGTGNLSVPHRIANALAPHGMEIDVPRRIATELLACVFYAGADWLFSRSNPGPLTGDLNMGKRGGLSFEPHFFMAMIAMNGTTHSHTILPVKIPNGTSCKKDRAPLKGKQRKPRKRQKRLLPGRLPIQTGCLSICSERKVSFLS